MWRPVIFGYWRHADLVSDVFTFHDLVEVNRVIDVVQENNHRRDEAARSER